MGRSLLEGVRSVKLFGEEIAVHAKIVNFQGLSSHADRDHLLAWIADIKAPKPQHVFIVHGDREVAPVFAETVKGMGFAAHAPQYTEEYDLIADRKLAVGYLPERKTRAYEGAPKATGAYQKLVQLGDMLIGLIRRSKGEGQQDGWPPLPRLSARSSASSSSEPCRRRTGYIAPASRGTPPRDWAWPASTGRRCSYTGRCGARTVTSLS